MSDKESQFPVRMQGIWRAGRERPSDYVPASAVARAQRGDRRAEARAGAEALLQSDAQAPATEGSLAPALRDTLGTLAERLHPGGGDAGRGADATAAALADRVRDAIGGEGPRSAADAAPPPRRRSLLGVLVAPLVVFLVVGGIPAREAGIDVGALLERLLDAAARELEALLR